MSVLLDVGIVVIAVEEVFILVMVLYCASLSLVLLFLLVVGVAFFWFSYGYYIVIESISISFLVCWLVYCNTIAGCIYVLYKGLVGVLKCTPPVIRIMSCTIRGRDGKCSGSGDSR